MEVKPAYKQTEVGVIPEDWEVSELTDLLDQSRSIRYGIVQPGQCEPRGSLMLRSQDYSKGWASPVEMHRVNSRLEHQYRNARIRSADLILTIVGAGIGQVAVAPPWLDGALLSRSTARIAVDEAIAARRFVAACLEGPVGKRQILNCQKEGAQPVVSCRDVGRFLIPTPPLSEQGFIAAALSDADALIESLEQLLAKKRQLKQGAMQELLTGKKRLPGFSGEWELVKAGDIGRFRGGSGFPTKVQGARSGRYPFFKVSDMNNEGNETFMGVANNYIGEEVRKQIGATAFPTNSIVFAKVGAAVFLERKKILAQASCLDNNMAAFVLDPNRADCRYIHCVLLDTKLGDLVSTTALPSLRGAVLEAIALVLPPLAEQSAIAAVLSDMDADIAALEAKVAKARQLKQGMMQELLTGRIRLV